MTGAPIPSAVDQLKEIKKNAGIICEAIASTAQAVLPLKERGITKQQLEVRVGQIWGYTRLNKDSLSSEHHCKKVMDLLQLAVTDVQLRLEDSLQDITDEREKAKELRKKLAVANKENDACAVTISTMERESSKMAVELAKVKIELEEMVSSEDHGDTEVDTPTDSLVV